MPIPILAGAIGLGTKVFGNIFGPEGRARRQARRAERRASGKKGIFGGFFKKVFNKRSKGQRLVDSSTRLLEEQARKDAKLRAKLEQKAKKSGVSTLKQFIERKSSVSAPLPPKINLAGSKSFIDRAFDFVGARKPQMFQIPLTGGATKAKFTPLDEPAPRPDGGGVDQKTLLYIGGGIAALLLIMQVMKK